MKEILEINFKTEASNLTIPPTVLLNKWCIKWENNHITVRFLLPKKEEIEKRIGKFHRITSTTEVDLGTIIDILTFATDLEIDTYYSYKLLETNSSILIKDLFTIAVPKSSESGDALGTWPVRINPHSTNNFTNEFTDLIKLILNDLSYISLKPADKKLLNYWRRGFDLANIDYYEESFLAFFKILEYFFNNNSVKTKDIPSKNLDYIRPYKFLKHMGFKKINKGKLQMLQDFIDIRNNLDIAHARIKPYKNKENTGMYITYIEGLWDLHDHIKEISRLSILHKIGLRDYNLENDGGLYKLIRKKTSKQI